MGIVNTGPRPTWTGRGAGHRSVPTSTTDDIGRRGDLKRPSSRLRSSLLGIWNCAPPTSESAAAGAAAKSPDFRTSTARVRRRASAECSFDARIDLAQCSAAAAAAAGSTVHVAVRFTWTLIYASITFHGRRRGRFSSVGSRRELCRRNVSLDKSGGWAVVDF